MTKKHAKPELILEQECLDLKARQKQTIIDMMLGDEEIGLYDDNPKITDMSDNTCYKLAAGLITKI